MYNIAKAVSRLDFAPKRSEIKITDVTQGLGEFVPKPARPVSFAALAATLKKAGYTLDKASIVAEGFTRQEAGTWYLEAPESKQRFELRGFPGLKPAAAVTVQGRWLPGDSAGGAEIISAIPAR